MLNFNTLHKTDFAIIFLLFFFVNYIIILKLLKLRHLEKVGFENYHEIESFRKHLWVLDFSATVYPLLGLLGTIFALMSAFNELSKRGISGASEISQAIGMALTATALGIFMSVWCYFFWKFFNDKLRSKRELMKAELLRSI